MELEDPWLRSGNPCSHLYPGLKRKKEDSRTMGFHLVGWFGGLEDPSEPPSHARGPCMSRLLLAMDFGACMFQRFAICVVVHNAISDRTLSA